MMSVIGSLRGATAKSLAALAATAFVAPLATRLVMGQAFFQTGRGKLENFSNTVAFFAELGIPMPELNAAFVSRLEYYGGIALLLGIGTRVVAALLSSTMVVALLTADKASFVAALMGTGEGGLTDVAPFVYLLLLGWLVLFGPGFLSLDAVLARLIGIGRRAAASRPSASIPAEAARARA